MAIHKTKTGWIELVDSWGHGKASNGKWHSAPATLVAEDGDGHYDAWKFSGDKKDAAVKIAEFLDKADMVVCLEGNSVVAQRAPGDFWTEDEGKGEFIPNLSKYPDVIAY